MIEQPARVLGILPASASQPAQLCIEVRRQSACGGCTHAAGCGTAVLAGLFGARAQRLQLPLPASSEPLLPGDEIQLGIAPRALLGSAMLAYVLPVLLMLLGAGLGQHLAGEVLSVLLAALGLASGLMLGRWLVTETTVFFTLRGDK